MPEIKYTEITNENYKIPEGKKRVEVQVYWRWEDCKTFDVPETTELADVRDQIVFKADDYFSSDFSWLTEFEVWNIRDEKGDDEWSL